MLPRESPERVILFTGAAVFVILTFIMFEILQTPLVILDARSDLEDPSEVSAKRIFTISVQGPIASLPKSISRLVHQRVHYRARGTGLQWLDFDPQKCKAIKVCSVAQRKLLLQDAHVPFDCASCRGSLHATETCFLFTLLIAFASFASDSAHHYQSRRHVRESLGTYKCHLESHWKVSWTVLFACVCILLSLCSVWD